MPRVLTFDYEHVTCKVLYVEPAEWIGDRSIGESAEPCGEMSRGLCGCFFMGRQKWA